MPQDELDYLRGTATGDSLLRWILAPSQAQGEGQARQEETQRDQIARQESKSEGTTPVREVRSHSAMRCPSSHQETLSRLQARSEKPLSVLPRLSPALRSRLQRERENEEYARLARREHHLRMGKMECEERYKGLRQTLLIPYAQ
jgi:hypothetical protein